MTKTQRPELTFDGFGINGPDEYRTRLATFSNHYTLSKEIIEKYGCLFAAAPELLASVMELLPMVEEMLPKHGPSGWGQIAIDNAKQAIARAKGQS